jgi:hypothetical protein
LMVPWRLRVQRGLAFLGGWRRPGLPGVCWDLWGVWASCGGVAGGGGGAGAELYYSEARKGPHCAAISHLSILLPSACECVLHRVERARKGLCAGVLWRGLRCASVNIQRPRAHEGLLRAMHAAVRIFVASSHSEGKARLVSVCWLL